MNPNTVHRLHDLPLRDDLRGFFDPIKTREWIRSDVLSAYQSKLNSLESPDYQLKVKDLSLPALKFSLPQQKKAILERTDLSVPLKGTVELWSKKTGTKLEEKKVTLAQIPWLTDRNTFVYNGAEYIMTNQQRLKPGVYTRVKETGEIEAHVNVKPGTGSSGKIIFVPEKALFVYVFGSTQIKLYGLLHDLGIPDSVMQDSWGQEIFDKNKREYRGDEVDKLYDKIFNRY